jgi:hypothetical protein
MPGSSEPSPKKADEKAFEDARFIQGRFIIKHLNDVRVRVVILSST